MVLFPIISLLGCTVALNMFRILYKYHFFSFSLIYPPPKHEKNLKLSLVTIGKYVRNNLESRTFSISHSRGGD